MKYFIDCGGHKGESVKKALIEYEGYKIHTFEANPNLWHYFDDLPTTLHRQAVSDEDGEANFYLGDSEGSTLLLGKRTAHINYEEPITVETIDLSQWLLSNFTEEDYIILKLDVEGAEDQIIRKMLADGSINLIDELWGEWHHYKIDSLNKTQQRELEMELELIGIKMQFWHINL